MKNKKRMIILIIVIVVTLAIAGIILYKYESSKEKPIETPGVKVTSNIDKYGYTLTDNDTDYYKELFDKLKVALEADPIDEELYASLISQLFVTDFYNLSNKLSSSDVGGLEFVLESYRDNFALKAKDTFYKSLKTNLYGDRDQALPTITKVSVDSIITTSYKYDDITDNKAFSVKCTVEYQEDLGYPTTIKLVLVHNNEKIEIAKVN